MADDDVHAGQTAYIGYALVHALLSELEKESPGLRKRVWLRAQESHEEYG
jgi:hypothetical protein